MSNNQQPKNTLLDAVITNTKTSVVIERILTAVQEGSFQPGKQIPSEPKLANQLSVSRNTVREAINSLVHNGILYRERGIGTFITAQSPKLLVTNLASALGTTQILKGQNKTPGQKNFSWTEEAPNENILEYLELQPGDLVMHISRLRTAGGIPFIQSDEYIPIGIPNMKYDFSHVEDKENWSMYAYLSKFGYEVNSVVTHVHAVSANKIIAKGLEIQENVAILKLDQTHYSNKSLKPILHSINYHNDNVIDMRIVRAGLRKV